eukprot:gnl/TRDRNA2_/TRDRNA2_154300_c0_seq1.p1 gnl/TRDRNA2_/TRDRNA2_154300_c0~~gnl/TRDRNA2_/TRDRNA2_154300_c0_seq1.p1  ORF type:complete len:840 (-),score=140.57 gnl/TRDRNA2_/TRDRNA2_154300_c0_seq1:245-2464(-)
MGAARSRVASQSSIASLDLFQDSDGSGSDQDGSSVGKPASLGPTAAVGLDEHMDPFERPYKAFTRRRQSANTEEQNRLKLLQAEICQPWESSAQVLVYAGSFMLILSACLLIFGRFYVEAPELPPPNLAAFPAAPLVAWGFSVPCIFAILVLGCLEVLLIETRRERRGRRKSERRKRESQCAELTRSNSQDSGLAAPDTNAGWDSAMAACSPVPWRRKLSRMSSFSSLSSGGSGPVEASVASASSPAATAGAEEPRWVKWQARLPSRLRVWIGRLIGTGASQAEEQQGTEAGTGEGAPSGCTSLRCSADQQALRLCRVLLVASLLDTPVLVLACELGKVFGSVAALSEHSPMAGPDGAPAEVAPVAPGALAVSELQLEGTRSWPSFWQPTGAVWLPRRSSLLLVGGQEAVEVQVEPAAGQVAPSLPRRMSSAMASPLADICVALDAEDPAKVPLLMVIDAQLTIHRLDLDDITSSEPTDLRLSPAASGTRHLSSGLWMSKPEAQLRQRWGPIALGCRATGTDLVQVWLTANEQKESWPTLHASELRLWPRNSSDESQNLFGSATSSQQLQQPQRLPHLNLTRQWATRWLLADEAVHAAIGSWLEAADHGGAAVNIVVESLEAAGDGTQLLLLITANMQRERASPNTSGRRASSAVQAVRRYRRPPQPLQLLVSVADGGRSVRGCWPLPPPAMLSRREGGVARPARWMALAADEEGEKLYLVAGGATPGIATVQLPSRSV